MYPGFSCLSSLGCGTAALVPHCPVSVGGLGSRCWTPTGVCRVPILRQASTVLMCSAADPPLTVVARREQEGDRLDLHDSVVEGPPPRPPGKVYSSTVALIPPASAWEPIQRARYQLQDKGLYRWPPHANLLYPFVGTSHFEDAAARLAAALRDVPPFTVRLSTFGIFGRKRSATLWLDPEPVEDSEALVHLQSALQSAMPSCREQTAKGGGGFTAHITVAHFDSTEAAQHAKEKLEEWWEPVTFRVEEVHVMARRDYSSQFECHYRIPLGQPAGPLDAPSRLRQHGPYSGMPQEPASWMVPLVKEASNGRPGKKGGRGGMRIKGSAGGSEITEKQTEDFTTVQPERHDPLERPADNAIRSAGSSDEFAAVQPQAWLELCCSRNVAEDWVSGSIAL